MTVGMRAKTQITKEGHMIRPPSGNARNAGFTLIEVLVALLILLVGLLGVAGTQLLSLQQVNNANLRSQINNHAVVELIRANDGQALAAATQDAWESGLVRDVPSAVTNIVVNANTATVTITWNEREYGQSDAAKTFTLAARIDQ